MTDPRRFQEDESVSAEMRRWLASAPRPGALPSEVYGRALGEAHRRLGRRRVRRRVAVGAVACAGLTLLAFGLVKRSSEIAPESVAGRSITDRASSADSPARPATPAVPSTPASVSYLAPSPSGWLERDSNPWGAQGAFYVHASLGSTVLEPAPPPGHEGQGWMWRNGGDGRLCLKGSSAGVQDGDFKGRWGVVAGMELCHASHTDQDPSRLFSIEQCPWGELDALRGIRFDLEGPKIPSEMRVVFAELGSTENAFVAVYDADPGRQEILLDRARLSYRQPPRPVRREQVRGVEWLVPSRLSEPAHFDFCLKNIELF